jgi:hypothetical protein
MKRYIRIVTFTLGMAVFLGSFAWAGIADEPGRKGYKLSEHTPHLWLYWNCDRGAGNAIGIDGLVEVKGESNTSVYALQLKLIGFDAKGKAISEQSGRVPVYKMDQDMPYRFHITLPMQGSEVDFGLRVYYRYIPVYGGGMKVSRISYGWEFYDWTFRELCPQEERR